MKKILAFETSCDDTAVAIVDETGRVLSDIIFSQLKEHEPYLGVVPEIGSRAHIEQIARATREAFRECGLLKTDIDAVAATFAPGLLGPLLVGAQFAKGFAAAREIPLIAVHHIEGHIFSGFGDEGFFAPPFLALIASGGHSAIYICEEDYSVKMVGETLDDAAGEAFDKIGRALGLGYPAGKLIDDLAMSGNKERFSFPVALKHRDDFNFSFSGLKTSALLAIQNEAKWDQSTLADLASSLQEAIAEALTLKTIKAALHFGQKQIVIGGGVAANSRLRSRLSEACLEHGLGLYLPKLRHCTDNAAMIGKAAHIKWRQGKTSELNLDVCASLPIERAHELRISERDSKNS